MKNFSAFVTNPVNLSEKTDEEIPQKDLHVVVVGKSDNDGTFADIIQEACEKKDIKFTLLDVTEAWISTQDTEIGSVVIQNYDGEDSEIELEVKNSIIFTRAGVVETLTSQAIISSLHNLGFFLVNDMKSMLLCDNKMASTLLFERNNISTPRTSILTNEKSIENAHKKIGGKFPIVMKTLRGTQGVGVSIIDSMASLNSVAQSLWKFDADILIQEYLDISSDIRTLVVGNKIIGSTQRTRAKDNTDFRNNTHRGATTKPYKLSEEEMVIIKAAARASGALYCGVDHAMHKDKPYIIEVNSSPGIRSDFNGYDIETGKLLGKTTGYEIGEKVIDYFSAEVHRRSAMMQEAGYIERINIVGYGPIRGKFDTGNGTRASMFVVDKIDIDGKTVKWEKDGKKFTSKLQGYSEPRASGSIEKTDTRPIILIDIEFNNKLYKKLPLGLTTKDSGSTVLINRNTLTVFNVSINPYRKFVLSDYIERSDNTDYS